MEPREVISEAEERFERWRKTIGLITGPVVFVILYFLPFPSLTHEAHMLLCVIGLVLVFWLTEALPIPVTALLGAVLNILLGVASAKEVFSPFAHPLVFLFIGSFILAEAISLHGLDKRFSLAILSIRLLERNPTGLLFAFGIIAAGTSMWVSNTASTAMMLPIAMGILSAIEDAQIRRQDFNFNRFSTMMMLMIAYGASVGGIATPVGTPPNLIGIGMIDTLLGVKIGFFEWMGFAIPITVAMFGFLFLLLGPIGGYGRIRLDIRDYIVRNRALLGSWSRGEINTAIAFSITVFLWILPSIVGMVLGKTHPVSELLAARLNAGVVAIMGAVLLFLLPVSLKECRFTMTWRQAVGIDWGTIVLFGGGLSLGKLMFSTGLAENFGRWLTGFSGVSDVWGLTAMGIIFAIILSETTSNTASANMVIPLIIAIAQSLDIPALPPALGACLGASFGFMLPVSTPPNAIVYGSGMVPILSMVRKGILFDIGGFFIILFGVMGMCYLFGWL